MKRIYENDRTAPRMKNRQFTKDIFNKDLWEAFKLENNSDISWERFQKIWDDITETIRHESVFNPLGVKLPNYMGEIKVQYLPYKFNAVDIPTSTTLGEKVNFLNLDERGKVARIKWERRWAVRYNKMLQFYAFDEHRKMSALAKQRLDENPDTVRVSRNTLRGFSVWRNQAK